MTDDKKKDKRKKFRMSKEEYLRTHLLDMDPAKKRWYIHAMETWTPEDYQEYQRVMLWMMGEPSEEDLKKVREIIGRKRP